MAETANGRRVSAPIPWLLLIPGLAWLILFFVVPLLSLFRRSLDNSERIRRQGGGGLENYTKAFGDFSDIIVRTFFYSLAATLVAIALGYPLAYFIATRGGRFKNALLALVVVPFFTTYLIRTIAWLVLLGDEGPVTGIVRATPFFADDGRILGTSAAVIGALVYNFLPFMVLPIYVSIEKLDRRLLEAGRDLYAGGARVFWKVTLPLTLPGVFAGSLLTFIPASGDFVNAELLGSDRTRMIGNIIERNFSNEIFRPGVSALSFVLMAILLVGVLLYARLLGTEELL